MKQKTIIDIKKSLNILELNTKELNKEFSNILLLSRVFGNTYKEGQSWSDNVVEAINTLANNEKEVLELRYGIKDGIFRTLKKTGEEMGLTQERIRQIEAKAFRKLRHPVRRLVILGYSWQMASQEAKALREKVLKNREIDKQLLTDKFSVENIELPLRTTNALKKADIPTINELIKHNSIELSKVRGIGTKSIKVIKWWLKEHNIIWE